MKSETQSTGARHASCVSFTLIELLVVVAILGILAGLLMPSLSKARARAQAVQCTHNLRQLGYAIQMYWNDNEGRIVAQSGLPSPSWNATGTTQSWAKLVYPYLKDLAIYRDPSLPKWMLPHVPVDYYLNILQPYLEGGGDPGRGAKTGAFVLDSRRIGNPAAFILMSEDLDLSRNPNDLDPTNEVTDRTGFSRNGATYPLPHHGFANFLFADNHVAAFSRFETNLMTYWYDKNADWAANLPP
ncbi:MAG: type II secretion system protein [Verrucomicrobiae bacterium]|nr:type II secretion system protein [Verrucomicrobiae bacterium]